MPDKAYRVGDTEYRFPDSYTDKQVQAILTKQNIIKPPAAKSSSFTMRMAEGADEMLGLGTGFLKGAGRTVLGAAELGSLPGRMADKLINPKFAAEEERFLKQAHEKLESRTGAEKGGDLLESAAELLLPGVPEMDVIKGAGRLGKIGNAAIRGAVDVGARTAIKSGSLKEGAEGAAVGTVAGAAGETILPPAARLLKRLAREQYGKILHPLGRAAKEVTEDKLLSGEPTDLVGRGVTGSKEKLRDRFVREATESGKVVDAEYNRLDQTKKTRLAPLFDSIDDWVTGKSFLKADRPSSNQNYLVGRATKVLPPSDREANPEMVKEGVDLTKDTIRLLGNYADKVPPGTIRNLRQLWDEELFGRNLQVNPATAADKVKKAAADSMRQVLHSQHPTTKDIDAEFSFWKSAANMMESRITSDTGKLELVKKMGNHWKAILGGVAGGEAGREKDSSALSIIAGAAAGAALGEAMASTSWQSVSAVTKNKVADLLVNGKGQEAAMLAGRAVGYSVVRRHKHPAPVAKSGAGDAVTSTDAARANP